MVSRDDIRASLRRAAKLDKQRVVRKAQQEQSVCRHPPAVRMRTETPRADRVQVTEGCEACGETLFRITVDAEVSK